MATSGSCLYTAPGGFNWVYCDQGSTLRFGCASDKKDMPCGTRVAGGPEDDEECLEGGGGDHCDTESVSPCIQLQDGRCKNEFKITLGYYCLCKDVGSPYDSGQHVAVTDYETCD